MAEIDNWSTSAALNTSVAGINIGEGMARSDVNNAQRAVMAAVKEKFDQTTGAFVTPGTYGAVGDGITNDSAAFSALQTAKPGRLVLGGGLTYKFASATSVPAGFKMLDGQISHADTVQINDDYAVLALGAQALLANTFIPEQHASSAGPYASGNHVVALGYQALKNSTTGRRLVAVGSRALLSNTTGYYNTALGSHAMENNTTGSENVAVGVQSLGSCTSGTDNTCVGSGAGNKITTGTFNIGLGRSSMSGVGLAACTGQYNTGIGFQALGLATSCEENVAIGRLSMQTTEDGSRNIAVGTSTLQNCVSGADNVGIGYQAMRVATGSNNVAIGSICLDDLTSGTRNVGIGRQAATLATTADDSVVIGYQAGLALTTGDGNTVVGASSGSTLATGNNNTSVGYGTGFGDAAASNRTVIGYGAVASADNQITLGNTAVTAMRTQGAITGAYNQAVPAGGAQAVGLKLTSTANLGLFAGSGAPNVSAAKGSIYIRTDGSGPNERFYTNTDGGTTWAYIAASA